jgi:hypothetical protein
MGSCEAPAEFAEFDMCERSISSSSFGSVGPDAFERSDSSEWNSRHCLPFSGTTRKVASDDLSLAKTGGMKKPGHRRSNSAGESAVVFDGSTKMCDERPARACFHESRAVIALLL